MQLRTAGNGKCSAFMMPSNRPHWRIPPFVLACIVLLSTVACAQPPPPHHVFRRRLHIFGSDDRRNVTDPTLYPYSAVGLLRWDPDHTCTASLIGAKYVLTAAECVLTKDGDVHGDLADAEFITGYGSSTTATTAINGKPSKQPIVATSSIARIHRQSDYWKKWTSNTYVILELAKPLGESHGILLLPNFSDLDQSKGSTAVQIVQYNDSVTASTTSSLQFEKCTCFFPSAFGGPRYLLHHDCDTSATGSPGAPLLVRYTSLKTYIIGIHSNAIGSDLVDGQEVTQTFDQFSDEVANRGVLGPFIQMHLQHLMQHPIVSSDSSIHSDDDSTDPSASSSVGAIDPSVASTSASRDRQETRSTDDSSVATNANASKRRERITPTVAWACIVFVCSAWACILFIAARHIRRGNDVGGSSAAMYSTTTAATATI